MPVPRGVLPGGGGPMTTSEYLDFVGKEYLVDYVARGGSAVKLLVTGSDAVAQELAGGLASIGDGFVHATVDAVATRVHMIDQAFAAVARQVDWVLLASAAVDEAYRRLGLPPPYGVGAGPLAGELAIAAVASHQEMLAAELCRSVRRALEGAVLHDATLSHECRVAMVRLCQELLGRGDVHPGERDAVLGWLH